MYTTPIPPEVTRRNSEPSTQQGTLGSLEREKGQIIFPGFLVLLTIFLVIIAACILWSWKKQKKRRVPYFHVAPSLTLPPPRQRAKNIYDFLPRQQVELGRHQLSGFSTESLLSRASDSPEPEALRASGSLQMHRVSIHAVEYTVGIYNNGTVPQMCGYPAFSAHHGCVRTSRTNPSISSKESNDYVNIPTAEDTSETLTCTKSTPENHLSLPSALQPEFAEGGHAGCGNATKHTGLWVPGPKCRDSLSDGDNSSQTSNDYVNMTGLDLEDIQENQPRVAFQGCRDYENVPSVDTNGSQLQTLEEVTSSTTDHGEPVWKTEYHMAFRPLARSEDGAVMHEEDQSSEDSSDYENVLAAELEGRDWKQGPGTRHPSDKGPPGDLAGKLCEGVYPAGSVATETSGEDA
ncbi:lymphocyte transmembrane adapter 1 [Apodemus sylvaticus]|uniref:lymphocyte transmembrane adapter 1 n=1 Tax=Apodemus sylvaticus TaxID=10129 RepID=UPI002241A461|nr:lymphocyte transmembrane adapter 1 [Apodemus sylvaticus]XP_052056209.1 lymphocyte transmembrane adapter 1 [Apodemus sylvaticus]